MVIRVRLPATALRHYLQPSPDRQVSGRVLSAPVRRETLVPAGLSSPPAGMPAWWSYRFRSTRATWRRGSGPATACRCWPPIPKAPAGPGRSSCCHPPRSSRSCRTPPGSPARVRNGASSCACPATVRRSWSPPSPPPGSSWSRPQARPPSQPPRTLPRPHGRAGTGSTWTGPGWIRPRCFRPRCPRLDGAKPGAAGTHLSVTWRGGGYVKVRLVTAGVGGGVGGGAGGCAIACNTYLSLLWIVGQ